MNSRRTHSVCDSTPEVKSEEESPVSQELPHGAWSLAGASEGHMDSLDMVVASERSCWGH